MFYVCFTVYQYTSWSTATSYNETAVTCLTSPPVAIIRRQGDTFYWSFSLPWDRQTLLEPKSGRLLKLHLEHQSQIPCWLHAHPFLKQQICLCMGQDFTVLHCTQESTNVFIYNTFSMSVVEEIWKKVSQETFRKCSAFHSNNLQKSGKVLCKKAYPNTKKLWYIIIIVEGNIKIDIKK
jgi:hypothetical protein